MMSFIQCLLGGKTGWNEMHSGCDVLLWSEFTFLPPNVNSLHLENITSRRDREETSWGVRKRQRGVMITPRYYNHIATTDVTDGGLPLRNREITKTSPDEICKTLACRLFKELGWWEAATLVVWRRETGAPSFLLLSHETIIPASVGTIRSYKYLPCRFNGYGVFIYIIYFLTF